MLFASDTSVNASGRKGCGKVSCTHSPDDVEGATYAPLPASYAGDDTHCWDMFWLNAQYAVCVFELADAFVFNPSAVVF